MARTESETTSQRRRPRAVCDREGGEGRAWRGAGARIWIKAEGREGEEKGSRSRVTGKKEPPSAKEEQSGLQTEAGRAGEGRECINKTSQTGVQ